MSMVSKINSLEFLKCGFIWQFTQPLAKCLFDIMGVVTADMGVVTSDHMGVVTADTCKGEGRQPHPRARLTREAEDVIILQLGHC